MKFIKKFSKIKELGFGRRQLILSCLILLIAVAGYINLNYTGIPSTNDVADNKENSVEAVPTLPTSTEIKDEFAQMKLERDKAQSESMAVYREIVDNEKTSTEARNKAQADLSSATTVAEKEKMIESLLEAKKFKDTIVYISGDNVNVIVKTDALVPSQIAQIKDIVIENTGFSADAIKIVEKN